MNVHRRSLLKYAGLSIAGLGLARLEAYAGASPGIALLTEAGDTEPLRLSANENPYGPSPLARAAMAGSIAGSNRYNWSTTGDLITAIARAHKVSEENVLIGAGSTELLDRIVQLFEQQKGSYVVADPSFTGWTATADKLGMEKIAVPLTADKKNDLGKMLSVMRGDTRFVYCCNPNNPTGTICDRPALEAFVSEGAMTATMVIDEAYLDYVGQESLAPVAAASQDIIVLKTFSKIYGLAGARIGYAIAHVKTIEKLSSLEAWPGGSVSVVSRAAAIASLKDYDFVTDCRNRNDAAKQYTVSALEQLGITCIPSAANFIYFSLAGYRKDFFALLKSGHIEGTRIFEEQGKWSRITIGTLPEMQRFIAAIA